MKWLLFVFFSSSALAQKLPDYGLNKVRIAQPDKTLVFEVTTKQESNLRTDRLYYWFGSNNVHMTQGGYSGRLLNGPYQELYPSKEIREQGTFKKGLKDGEWKYWQADGTLSQLTTWRAGVQHGHYIKYGLQGKVDQTGDYKDGVLDGKVYMYHGTGSVDTVVYKNGILMPKAAPSPGLWQRIKKFRIRKKKITGENEVKQSSGNMIKKP